MSEFEKWATKHIVSKRLLEFNISKYENGSYKSRIMQRKFEAWQAAKADSEREILELKARALEESNKYVAYCDLAEAKITELQTHNTAYRKAVEEIASYESDKFSVVSEICEAVLQATPAQSLQAHDELIERCAIRGRLAQLENKVVDIEICKLKGK